jgi:hypothetical protein
MTSRNWPMATYTLRGLILREGAQELAARGQLPHQRGKVAP